MPNHITNELTASQSVLDAMAGPESAVDFNAIVPMPEILKCKEGQGASLHIEDWANIALGIVNIKTLREQSLRLADPAEAFRAGNYGAASDTLKHGNIIRSMTEGPFPKDFSDDDFDTLVRYMTALRKYGKANWYAWSIENWGTKWNAYSIQKRDGVLEFDTAWSAPLPVVLALSKRFPEERIKLRWADEDFGSNVGDLTFLNGDVVAGQRLKNGTPESHRIAMELLHGNKVPDHMQMGPDGKYIYKDGE